MIRFTQLNTCLQSLEKRECLSLALQMSVDSSLLAELRQDHHVAALEADLKELATTVERMSLSCVQRLHKA